MPDQANEAWAFARKRSGQIGHDFRFLLYRIPADNNPRGSRLPCDPPVESAQAQAQAPVLAPFQRTPLGTAADSAIGIQEYSLLRESSLLSEYCLANTAQLAVNRAPGFL